MKKTRRILSLILASVLAASVLCACGNKEESSYVVFRSSDDYAENYHVTVAQKVKIPMADEECKGYYYDVYESFKEAGFANIEYEGLSDLLSKDKTKDEQISEITVDGKKDFKKGDKVMSDVKVVIKYHSMKTAYMPFDADEAEGMDYEDAVTQLKDKGFTNISTKAVEDSSKDQDSVKSVSVNGKTDYKSYDGYVVDAKIIVTYYTKPKKTESKQESKKESSDSNYDLFSSAVSKVAEDTVTPSFKEYMDSYEEFMDKYIELLKNYNSDPMKYLSEYMEYMEKLSEFSEKIDAYNEDDMSAADWLYYLEVKERVNKKLAEVK